MATWQLTNGNCNEHRLGSLPRRLINIDGVNENPLIPNGQNEVLSKPDCTCIIDMATLRLFWKLQQKVMWCLPKIFIGKCLKHASHWVSITKYMLHCRNGNGNILCKQYSVNTRLVYGPTRVTIYNKCISSWVDVSDCVLTMTASSHQLSCGFPRIILAKCSSIMFKILGITLLYSGL